MHVVRCIFVDLAPSIFYDCILFRAFSPNEIILFECYYRVWVTPHAFLSPRCTIPSRSVCPVGLEHPGVHSEQEHGGEKTKLTVFGLYQEGFNTDG